MDFNSELWESLKPTESVIRGLKARLQFCSQDIICTPANRCACDQMLEDLKESQEWIDSLPGEASSCDTSNKSD